MSRILSRVVSFLAMLLFVAACGSPTAPPQPPDPDPSDPARIEVTPGTLLLTSAGEETQLTAVVYDHEGDVLDVEVTWSSLDPTAATVTADGLVRAATGLGSGQVLARVGTVESAPVLVLIAQPAAGALLIDDDQVVGGPTVDDTATTLELGLRYDVTVRGIDPPAPGRILLTRGELPVGGRVVASQASGDGAVVTLEIVPIQEMFAALRIDESLDLTHAEVELPDRLGDDFEVRRLGPGQYRLVSDPARVWSVEEIPAPQAVGPHQAVGTRALGPFECAFESAFASLDLKDIVLDTTHALSFDFQYDDEADRLLRAVATGTVTVELGASLTFTAAYEGKFTCKGELAQFTLPIGGPLALIVGGHVPMGAGFEVAGKVTVAEVGFKPKVTSEHTLSLGIDCTAADTSCSMVNSYDEETDGTLGLVLPDPTSQLRVEASLYGFGFIDLAIGNRFFEKLRFTAFSIKAGLKQSANLAPIEVQASDTAYASDLKLELEFSAGVGTDLFKLLNLLQISLNTTLIKETVELATSPVGTIEPRTDHDHAEPVHVRPSEDGEGGDLVEFVVELDKRTYFGADIVDGVTLLKRNDEGELVSFASDCEGIDGDGLSFTCETEMDEEHVGDNEIYAFIDIALFGEALQVAFEIAQDGKTDLAVDPEPTLNAVTISVGATVTAGEPTPQEFKVDWDDKGENLDLIRDRFVLLPVGSESTFEDAVDDAAVASGFDGPGGIGTYTVETTVACDQAGNPTIHDHFVLVDEFGHESEEVTVISTVDYSGC